MKKFLSLVGAAGFIFFLSTIPTLVAQPSAKPQAAGDQSENIKNFLKAYGSQPSVPETAPPAPAADQNEEQSQPPLAQPSQPEPAPPSQPQSTPEPYKSLHDKSVWERLKAPPKANPDQATQPNTPPAETYGQSPNTQQNADQAPTSNSQEKGQTTPGHYNIFQ